ncbi:GNAT family N-acetyltransferase [Clostridium sp. P21]|uniref:GNAT family N-acetyltransferase n=1 Tax=Clostridium muellerianum TaxID=2716538 RepID=A0A7Y0EFY9_9CLOT|nr:GNAT family N-acetyltransferase [Clostridium muellerianum]NMM62691.1 GNAT family N-acetyltransferase [Clostridium muellerianum]
MYQCVTLNKRNFGVLRKLNEIRNNFNSLNEDFFAVYNECNFAGQILLKRKVKLLKKDEEYIGYMWFEMTDKNNCNINSLSVSEKTDYIPYKFLLTALKSNCTSSYLCEDNDYNFDILKNIGFNVKDGTLILCSDTYKNVPLLLKDDLEFENFKMGFDEQIRCTIQNEVFKEESRVPLSLEDIYYDELQSYYFDRGAVFLKKDGKHIGYGQIIIEDNTPFIVNFGILEEYRGKGYSKSLFTYLLKICSFNGFDQVKIKVKISNIVALNLYKSLDFKTLSKNYRWELKK